MNAFEVFGVEPSVVVDGEWLSGRYRELAAEKHPDAGGDKERFEEIGKAHDVLKSVSGCARHFMEVRGITYDARGSVGDELMDLFMEVGGVLQRVDGFVRKKEKAASALAKALLEGESMEMQELLEVTQEKVEGERDLLIVRLREGVADGDLAELVRDLAFLEKWQVQLRGRYGSLF